MGKVKMEFVPRHTCREDGHEHHEHGPLRGGAAESWNAQPGLGTGGSGSPD